MVNRRKGTRSLAPPHGLAVALAHGMDALSTESLLEVVARRSAPGLLARVGGIERLAAADEFELAAHLDERDLDTRDRGEPVEVASAESRDAARAIAAAFELGRRLEEARAEARVNVFDTSALARWARPRLAGLTHEEAWVLALDGSMNLRAARCIARGGMHSAGLRAADAVRAAIRLDASAFLLVHNHPSGDPTPSPADVEVTQRIAAVAAIADIPLLDHLVIARSGSAAVPFR